ncbi:MAG: M15 family metallopeptidase [Clostridiales bacterium]|nr:M15 family metallopeptidase [Clostridiales bacterium]
MKKLIAVLVLCALALTTAFAAEPEATPAPEAALPAIMDLGGTLFLVNAQNRISKSYVPENLVKPDVQTRKQSLQENILMCEEAARALEEMFEAAFFEKGYTLYATSGYRSYGIQQLLFNAKVEEVGSKAKAQRRVAQPGTSEHQLGLAMDIQTPTQTNLNANFGDTEEGIWVAENAHRFGYIIRYQEEWKEITGIIFEPWHLRYVGVAHATALYGLNVPLEIYSDQARKLPEYVLTKGNHYLLEGLIGQMIAGDTPEALASLGQAETKEEEAAMRAASIAFLPEDTSYDQAVWYAYPTPRPTSAPRVDRDEETSLFQAEGG